MNKKPFLLLPLLIVTSSCNPVEIFNGDLKEGKFDFDYHVLTLGNTTNLFEDYFGIDDEETEIFENQKDFDDFEKLFVDIDNDEKVEWKTNSGYFDKQVDFSQYNVAVTAAYCPNAGASFSVSSITKTLFEGIRQYITCEINVPALASSTYFFLYTIVDKKYDDDNFNNTFLVTKNYNPYVAYKPIIYFYPEAEMDLEIKHYDPSKLITTYPNYNNGWNIHLNKDGTFTTENNEREYYAIYFDEIANYKSSFSEGFVVNKENAAKFLEEKLDFIGYTNREVNECIMYWLPILEENKNSFVYFEQTEIRNQECPLTFSTQPDTLIRTILHIKKVNKNAKIKEQELTHYEREGFTVTEWGGIIY